MNTLIEKLKAYEKSGEELANVCAVLAIGGKFRPSVEEGRELMDRVLWAEGQGARAERSILECTALGAAIEIAKRKLAEK